MLSKARFHSAAHAFTEDARSTLKECDIIAKWSETKVYMLQKGVISTQRKEPNMSYPTNKLPSSKNRHSKRLCERASMTTLLLRRLTLEPRDEGLDGELLGESARATVARGWGSRRGAGGNCGGNCGRSARGSAGRSGRWGDRGSRRLGRGRGRGSTAGASAEKRRTRDGVLDVLSIDVEDDTLLIGLVDGSTSNTFGLGGAVTSDLDVQALGVCLSAVGRARTVQRNDLVTEDVFASGERRGNSDRECVVVLDHLDRSPLAIREAIGLDLGPLQVLLLDRGDVTSVRSDVGDDGSDVGFGPLGPVKLNGATGSDLGHRVGRTLGAGGLVADDVGLREGVGLNKTVVEVLGVPANVVGDLAAALLCVVVVELEAARGDAVNGNTSDGTVGGSSCCESGDSAEGSDSLVHLDRSKWKVVG
jgi:hypothetical protein